MVLIPDLPQSPSTRQAITASLGLQPFLTGKYIPSIPPALAGTQPGQQISGLVLGVNPQGQALVQTPLGQVALASSLKLAAGQQLVLEVLPTSGRGESGQPVSTTGTSFTPQNQTQAFTARIVRVDGTPPQAYYSLPPEQQEEAANTQNRQQQGTRAEATLVRAIYPEPTARPATTKQAPPRPGVEFTPTAAQTSPPLKAIVLTAVATPQAASINPKAAVPVATTAPTSAPAASAASSPSPATLPVVQPGDNVTVKFQPGSIVLPTTTPTVTQAQNPSGTQVTTPQQSTAVATNTAPTTATALLQTSAPTPVQQQPLPATSTALPAFSAAAATPLPPTPGIILPATVIAQEASGEAIVHTAIGSLRLPPEVPLPKGTTLNLELISVKPGIDPSLAEILPPGFTSGNLATDTLIRGSTGLDSLLRHLFALSPQTAQQVAQQSIPQPGRQFTTKMLSYLHQVKEGSFMDNLAALIPRHLADEVNLPRFMQEFASLKQAFTETQGAQQQSWLYTLVPVQEGDEMRHMRWFKREQQGSAKNPNAKGTRFVIELDTESLGTIQMDGLFFKQPKTSDFDLVIRTSDEFSEEQQQSIRGIFEEYGQIGGYAGTLQFQATKTFPVNPLSDIAEESTPHTYSV